MPTCLRTCTSSTSGAVDVLAQDLDRAGGAHVAEALVDAIDAAQEGRLAAARRADQRGDDALLDLEVDVEQRLEGAVPEVEVPGLDGRARGVDSAKPPLHVVAGALVLRPRR